MYGKRDVYGSGTNLRLPVKADGMEQILNLEECSWSEDDNIPGQIRFEFAKAGTLGTVAVKFYLHDGFDAPEPEEEIVKAETPTIESREVVDGMMQSYLTGEWLPEEVAKRRPMAVMLGNNIGILPQWGLSKASIIAVRSKSFRF